MQIKRQKISFNVVVFIWLFFFGVQSLVLELIRDNEKVSNVLGIVLPIFLLVLLVGLIVGNKYLIRDDMITITEKDHQLSRFVGYIVAVPLLILILFDYLVKENPTVNFVVNLVASIFLMAVSLFGIIYFGIIALQKPKSPFKNEGQVIEAEFKEKDNNLPH